MQFKIQLLCFTLFLTEIFSQIYTQSCPPGYFYKKQAYDCRKCTNNACIECPVGYKANDQKCQKCESKGCIRCNFSPDHCTSCQDGYGIDMMEGKCFISEKGRGNCFINQYPSGAKCLPCTEDKCVNCAEGYRVQDQKCLKCQVPGCKYCHYAESYCSQCMEGYSNFMAGDCQKCSTLNCAYCPDYLWNCQRCKPGYKLRYLGTQVHICQKQNNEWLS